MNKFKHIFCFASFLAISLLILLQSCKSDQDYLIDQFIDIADSVDVEYGQTFNILSLKTTDDVAVIPASIANLSYNIEDEDFITHDNYSGEFKAVGIGTTTIRIYRNNSELLKQINVTVRSPFEFADIPDNTLNLKYGETFNIFKPNEQSKYNISSLYSFNTTDYSVATVGYQGDIRAVGLGSATITVQYKTGNQETAKQINVNVIPTVSLSLEMKSGESIDLAKLLPAGQVASRYTSNNTQTAEVNGSIVYARKAGAATLQSNTAGSLQIISVTVTEGSIKDLFKPLSWLSGYFVYTPDIETGMKNYTCTANEERTINGTKYQILQYKPFDNTISITFYCIKDFYTASRDKLDYAIIETGKSSADVLGWLYNNYSFTTYGYIQPQYFNLSGGYWTIRPENNSWSTLRIE
ncbi:MAG: hypothetical protein K2M14_07230 [Muribaculaceae bacterium]|nr:hypothetical protein [Muribaculaceae bacterium]